MSLGVVGEHTERLFECSPYKHRFFLHIRRQFCVLQTTLHLSCSPYTLKYFLCILYRCLNTTIKGQHFKKCVWGLYNCLRWTGYKFNFLEILKTKLLYVYTENTLNGKLSPKSVYISFNNNTNFKFFRFFPYTRYGFSLKTYTRYCPFKALTFV